jgi:hypothetical protein
MNVKQIKERISMLKAERANFETQWQEIADYMYPRKNTVNTQRSPGQKRNVQILDSTGMNSLELLAGALHGMLTNPNAMWFELTTGNSVLDKDDSVRIFLQEITRMIHNTLNNSNFQTEVHELYMDLCGFGTSAMLIEEDDEKDVRFSSHFIGKFFISEDHLGQVNQIYREWEWSSDKIVNEFGADNCPAKVREAFEKGKNEKFKIVHAVYPRSYVPGADDGGLPFVSQYVLIDHDHELRVGGFEEFPYVTPRWSKGTGEIYGTSPAMIALPEVKVINKMEEIVLNGAAKVIDPPIELPDDGYVLPIITRPGGINYKRSGTDSIRPIFNDTRIDFGFEIQNRKRTKIREAFYVDQLQLQQGPMMTATEVLQRTEEKMRLLGPMLGRQQSEFLRPLVDRVFAILLRRGKIPREAIPPILAGRKLDVRYSSMIAKSQRLSEGQSILRTIEAAAPFLQMDPNVIDLIDAEKAVKVIAEIYGFPQEIIRPLARVQQIRQQRAEAQQEQAEMQKEMQEAEMMVKAAPVLQKAAQEEGV